MSEPIWICSVGSCGAVNSVERTTCFACGGRAVIDFPVDKDSDIPRGLATEATKRLLSEHLSHRFPVSAEAAAVGAQAAADALKAAGYAATLERVVDGAGVIVWSVIVQLERGEIPVELEPIGWRDQLERIGLL